MRHIYRELAACALLLCIVVTQNIAPLRAYAEDATATSTEVTADTTDTPQLTTDIPSESPTEDVSMNNETTTPAVVADTPPTEEEGGLPDTASSTDATLQPEAPVDTATTTQDSATTTADDTTTDAEASSTPLTSESASTTEATTTDGVITDDASSTPSGGSASAPENADLAIIQLTGSTTGTTTIKLATSSPDTASSTDATSTEPVATTTIDTGDAYSVANVVNMVNTNLVNSAGSVSFNNFIDDAGTIDTRDMGTTSTSSCSLFDPCSSNTVSLNLLNDATITNQITIQAASGGNLIENASNALIKTGNAFSGLNLVNLANLNFVNANYFLTILNAFKNVNGDIVFPNLAKFFDGTLGIGPDTVNTSNTGGVNNDIAITADSGTNSTDATSSQVTSGNSLSLLNIFNHVNHDLVGSNFSILFHISGNWSGDVFSAPEGLFWERTADGILFSTNDPQQAAAASDLTVNATNTALIDNQVRIGSLSGDNAINNADNANILTGESRSVANIVNLANSNVISKNFFLAIVNIFGNFNGNIAFGRPDLKVSMDVIDPPANIQNGDRLMIRATVTNAGDAPSTATKLNMSLSSYLSPEASTTSQFELGVLPAGSSTTITYPATVTGAPDHAALVATAQADEHETDNAHADNLASVTVYTGGGSVQPAQGGGGGYYTAAAVTTSGSAIAGVTPSFIVVRNPATKIIQQGESRTVHQFLSIMNDSDSVAHHVTVRDITRDPNGNIIDDEPWDLGDVKAHEEIQLEYDATFAENAPMGTYVLSTEVTGDNLEKKTFNRNGIVQIEGGPLFVGTNNAGIPTSTIDVIRALPVIRAKAFDESTTTATSTDTLPLVPNAGTGDTPPSGGGFPYELLIAALAPIALAARFLMRKRSPRVRKVPVYSVAE